MCLFKLTSTQGSRSFLRGVVLWTLAELSDTLFILFLDRITGFTGWGRRYKYHVGSGLVPDLVPRLNIPSVFFSLGTKLVENFVLWKIWIIREQVFRDVIDRR